jgi:hypothetical protein
LQERSAPSVCRALPEGIVGASLLHIRMRASPTPAIRLATIPQDRRTARLPERPFSLRLARAVSMLMAAVCAHLWLARAPQPARSAISAAPTSIAGKAAATRPRPRQVRIAVETIRVPAESNVRIRAAEVVPLRARASRPEPAVSFERMVEPKPAATSGSFIHDSRSSAGVHVADQPSSTASESPSGLGDAREPLSSSDPLGPVATVRASVPPAAGPAGEAVPRPTPLATAESRAMVTAEPAPQEQHVLDVLNRYRLAYESLDASAAKAVWPSLDDHALRKAFRELSGQQVQFASCGVSINGRDAAARCKGKARYLPRVGSKPVVLLNGEWTFNLSRDEAGWQIVNAEIH